MNPRNNIEIVTFGCRLNAFESDVMRRLTAEAGLRDAVIVNTCAVTLAPDRYAAFPEVDLVLDNTAKLRPDSYSGLSPHPPLAEASGSPSPAVRERVPEAKPRAGEGVRARAYLQVQQGCDHRCTFCIIPYARGPSRSVPLDHIIAEARALLAAGYREIVLTGVDLTAYGTDLPEKPTLGQMVRRLLAAIPELPRLRLSSLDPSEVDDDLWDALADEPRLMPHLHLSLQSGDDLILKRMKRRHSRAQAIAAARRAHGLRPDIALGADLIAGFPTETEEMFRRTLDIVAECGIAFVHVFPYSPRPGTPAARMPQLDPALVKERAARLRAAGVAALKTELLSRIGRDSDVLIEAPGRGRADCYAAVRFDAALDPGTVTRMRFAGAAVDALVGVSVL